MSQTEVLRYLRSKGRPVDMQELLRAIPCNRATISKACAKLRKSKEVRFKKQKIKSYEKYFYFI